MPEDCAGSFYLVPIFTIALRRCLTLCIQFRFAFPPVVMVSLQVLSFMDPSMRTDSPCVLPNSCLIKASVTPSLACSRACLNSFGGIMGVKSSNLRPSSDFVDRNLALIVRKGALVAGVNRVAPSCCPTPLITSLEEEGVVSKKALVCRLQANVFGSCFLGMESYQSRVKRTPYASLSKMEDGFDSEYTEWQQKGSNFQEKTLDFIKSYPWGTLCRRFLERTLDLVWIPTKWLAVPVLVLSSISELLYTLTMKKDIFIPLGILAGFLLAKVVGGAALDVARESEQDRRASWPLMLLALFFLLLKLSGPYLPSWSAIFVPHMANAGLLKIFFQIRQLRQLSLL